jgi:hypothetical protein
MKAELGTGSGSAGEIGAGDAAASPKKPEQGASESPAQ